MTTPEPAISTTPPVPEAAGAPETPKPHQHRHDPVNPKPPLDKFDTFATWLVFANAGMLHRGNAYCFDYAVKHLPSDAPIVEIGSFCGLSTNLLTHFKRLHGKKNQLITCDRWLFEGARPGSRLGDSPLLHDDYRQFVMETYRRNVSFFSRGDVPSTVEMYSDEFFDNWRRHTETTDIFGRHAKLGGPISFCYIDGNHTYEFAKRDFENTHEFLEPGGFVLFDDSMDGSWWEVCKLVAEIKEMPEYELVIQNPNYMFVKK